MFTPAFLSKTGNYRGATVLILHRQNRASGPEWVQGACAASKAWSGDGAEALFGACVRGVCRAGETRVPSWGGGETMQTLMCVVHLVHRSVHTAPHTLSLNDVRPALLGCGPATARRAPPGVQHRRAIYGRQHACRAARMRSCASWSTPTEPHRAHPLL